MTHLHIPDGVLPLALWGPGLALALLLLAWAARVSGAGSPQRIAYRGALGALVLAAMAVEVPLGPVEYHLTLVGPVGVLLGAAATYEVVFVASAILAFVGHGGLTVIGLNALVLGAGGALARPVYRALAGRVGAPGAMATATAATQAVSGVLWLLVVAAGVAHGTPDARARLGLLSGVAFPLFVLGIAVESIVAFGTARFIARVRPDLLPGAAGRHAVEGAA